MVINFFELITISVPPYIPIALQIGIGKNSLFIFFF